MFYLELQYPHTNRHTHTHRQTHTDTHTDIHTGIHTQTGTQTHTDKHTQKHTQTHTQTYTQAYTHIHIHPHTQTYTHRHTQTRYTQTHTQKRTQLKLHVFAHIHEHVHKCAPSIHHANLHEKLCETWLCGRVSARGAMGCWINPSRWSYWVNSHCKQNSTTGLTKVMVYTICLWDVAYNWSPLPIGKSGHSGGFLSLS